MNFTLTDHQTYLIVGIIIYFGLVPIFRDVVNVFMNMYHQRWSEREQFRNTPVMEEKDNVRNIE